MIKLGSLGMMNIARNNPVLKSASDVVNNSFLVENGITYLIDNVLTGDEACQDGIVLKAGEPLNGFDVAAWNGMELVVDEKHIDYKLSKTYADMTAGTVLKVGTNGKLENASAAPTEGVYFVVAEKTRLTEKALKVRIVVVDKVSG